MYPDPRLGGDYGRLQHCPSAHASGVLRAGSAQGGGCTASELLSDAGSHSSGRQHYSEEIADKVYQGVAPGERTALVASAGTSFLRRNHIKQNPFVYFDPIADSSFELQDKVGDDPEAINTLLIAQEAFETLQDDRRRCEYDKAHRIKGKWPIQTCRNAFRDEYREIEREMYEKYLEALEEKGKARRTWGSREGDESEWSSRESESTRSYRMRSEGRQPEPEKRSSVPPATARVEDEPDDVLNAVVTGLAWGAEGVVAFLGGACAVVTYHFGLLLRFLGSPFNATDV